MQCIVLQALVANILCVAASVKSPVDTVDSRLSLHRGVPNGICRLLVEISLYMFLFGREWVKKVRLEGEGLGK